MKRSRRKLEELLWLTGVHATARSLYRATLGCGTSARRRSMSRFYGAMLPPGSLVFDVGANVGALSAIFSSLKTRVIALEPNADCVRHIQLSYGNEPIEVLQVVAGPRNGLAVLQLSNQRDDISSLSHEWMKAIAQVHSSYSALWSEQVTVPMLTLDTLLEYYGAPHFIKIDVEGYEEFVLDGLSVQPPLLSFEFNQAYLKAAMRCLDKRVFTNNSEFNFAMGDPVRFELDNWVGKDQLKTTLSNLPHVDRHGDIFVRRNNLDC